MQTAAAVGAALGVRLILDERLREKSYGEAEGRPEAWFRARFTFLLAAWIKMPIGALDYVSFGVASGSITELREDDHFHNRHVAALGDTSHLHGLDTG